MITQINQSLIKTFFYKGEIRDYCPYKVYCTTIAKTHEISSESMDAGSYFETLCLGSGRDGKTVTDLKRKKLTAKQIQEGMTIGSKSIDQIRIEQQALIFEQQKAIYQINVMKDVNTQVTIYKQWSKNDCIDLFGNLDIFPTTILLPKRGLRLTTIDTKLTKKFSTWGEFAWETPEIMDHTQGFMYHELMRDIDIDFVADRDPESRLIQMYTGAIKNQLENNDPLFFYWIFNYDTTLKNKFVEVPYKELDNKELHESIRKTINELNERERKGWNDVFPTKYNCGNCPVLNCPSKYTSSSENSIDEQFQSI